jgi:hypothetical protein
MTSIVLAALVALAALAVLLLSRLDTTSGFEAIASEATGLESPPKAARQFVPFRLCMLR